jgi:hypothetical protein
VANVGSGGGYGLSFMVVNDASLPPLCLLVCPPNGTRVDRVPHPSRGVNAYSPEVREQVCKLCG